MKTGEVVPHHHYLTIYTNFKTYGTFELGKDDGGIVVFLSLATNVPKGQSTHSGTVAARVYKSL
jgi:hypothetical protein